MSVTYYIHVYKVEMDTRARPTVPLRYMYVWLILSFPSGLCLNVIYQRDFP